MTSSDTALVATASAGDRNAFAALIARTAPDLAASLPASKDHHNDLRAIYTLAMRELHDGATPTDVNAWLLQLAQTRRRQANRQQQTSTQLSSLDHDLDRLWTDLAPLWPQGRRPFISLSRPVRVVGISVILLLGGLYGLIQFQTPQREADTLIATVYEPTADDQPALDPPAIEPEIVTVPVIPLPPLSDDDQRAQQSSPPATDEGSPTAPNDANNNEDTSEEPDPTEPEEPTTDPAEPEEPTTDPTEPEEPTTDPAEPEEPTTEL
ncbi:MAG: hypothetical protein WD360_03090 [Nitriliruptoraceae bacterium]